MKKIIWAGVVSLIFFLGIVCYEMYSVLSIETFEMDVYIVEDEAGFNLDEDKLHFGIVPVYSDGAYRELIITNVYEDDVRVFLFDSGDIDEYVYFEVDGGNYEKYNFVLKENDSKSFKAVFKNGNTSAGDYYTGELRIVVKRLII